MDCVYDLTDVHSGEYLEADVSELTLVETVDKADDYLRKNPPEESLDYSKFKKEAETMPKQEPNKPSARELSAQIAEERKILRKKKAAEIDNLLDQRNWYADMLAKTNDETYGDRLFAVEAELKRLVETE
jgi:hypothetical protein